MSTLTDAATEQVRTLVRRALQPGAYQTQALHRAMNEIAVIVGVDGDREQALDELEGHLAQWRAATLQFAAALIDSEVLTGDEIDHYPRCLPDFAEVVLQVQEMKVRRLP
jgi:hypothetical protein